MKQAANILCIESTDLYCSAAMFSGTQLLAHEVSDSVHAHAELLAPMVAKLCASANLVPDAVAISKGPGSYTGLRIGASLAKGLCFGWNVPLIAVDTLEALAWSMKQACGLAENTLFVPMTDARRMEVYTAVFDGDSLICMLPVHAKILTEHDFQDLATGKTLVFGGSGAAKWKTICSLTGTIVFLEHLLPSATGMGALANKAYEEGRFSDVAYFEPFYLKQFLPGKGSVT
jgi:tRNA threonylcarbamoyladenosine biosynthesis protein TsaB